MNSISDTEQLCNLINETTQLLIYGAGFVGKLLMKNIKLRKWHNDIRLIIVSSTVEQPIEIYDVPVVPLDCVGHYKLEGTILVATYEKLHSEISKVISDFKNVCYLTDGLINELIDYAEEPVNIPLKTWLDEEVEFRRLFRWIEIQNELTNLHEKSFAEYKGAFKGREVVIVATGPTVDKYKYIQGAIHIGVNKAILYEDIPLDYYFIQDGIRDNSFGLYKENIEKFDKKIFVGKYVKDKLARLEFPVDYFSNKDIGYYYTGIYGYQDIHTDITKHILFESGSIIFPALQFALFTHPKRIYLVGCDVNGAGHGRRGKIFLSEKDSSLKHQLSMFKSGYARIKEFADHYYPDVEIVSVNPVGLKKLFKDMYME